MKLHHFALFFAVIAVGFGVTAQILLVSRMQREGIKRTDYDCLVAAVNAAAEVAFTGTENKVTEAGIMLAEEVFFQTLAVLRTGAADRAAQVSQREAVPCLVVFGTQGYYRYCFVPEKGYEWTEMILYEEGEIPESFFEDTEVLLGQYHSLRFCSEKKYRVEQACAGVWEQSIEPPCVFAVYAPQSSSLPEDTVSFLYAAAGRRQETYFVTEDMYCHLPFCVECKEERIVARYATQKESAESGALPCERCLK